MNIKSTISSGHLIILVRSTSCISALQCNGSSDVSLRTLPSQIRQHDNIWMSTLMGNSPYQLRAGGAFDYNYGANHSIVSNDVAIQRPALKKIPDILTSVSDAEYYSEELTFYVLS